MTGWKGKAFVRVKESRGGPPPRDPLFGGSWDYIRTPGGGRVDRAIVYERFMNGHGSQPRDLPPGLNNEQGGFGEPQNADLAPPPAQNNHPPQQGGGQRPPPPEREGEDGNETESSSDGEPGDQVVEEPQAANPPSGGSLHGILRNNNTANRSHQAAAASHRSQNQSNANRSRQAAAASHSSRNQINARDAESNARREQSIRSNATAPIHDEHDEHSVHGSQIAADASVRSGTSNSTTLARHGRRVAGGNQGPAPRAHFAPPGYWNAPGAGGGPLPHGQARFEEASQRGRSAASFFNPHELRAWNEGVQLPPGMTREQFRERMLAEPPTYPGLGRRRRRYNHGSRFGV